MEKENYPTPKSFFRFIVFLVHDLGVKSFNISLLSPSWLDVASVLSPLRSNYIPLHTSVVDCFLITTSSFEVAQGKNLVVLFVVGDFGHSSRVG